MPTVSEHWWNEGIWMQIEIQLQKDFPLVTNNCIPLGNI